MRASGTVMYTVSHSPPVLEIGPISIGIFRHDLMSWGLAPGPRSEAGTEGWFDMIWDPNQYSRIFHPQMIQGYSTLCIIILILPKFKISGRNYLLPRSSRVLPTNWTKDKLGVSLLPADNLSSSTSPVWSRWDVTRKALLVKPEIPMIQWMSRVSKYFSKLPLI